MIHANACSFQPLTQLATGGMGVVYLGIHPSSRTLGAIKTMFRQHLGDPARLDRFRREVRLHAKLQSPHIVTCLEAVPDAESPALVLEYLRGVPLDTRLEKGALPVWEVAELVEVVAAALVHLHSLGVMHHDLKPSNLYSCRSGRYVLLDMGVAASTTLSEASSRTFLYSAPEVNTQDPHDPRADLYSLGLVLFEALTGVRGLEASTLAGAIHEQQSLDLPDPRDLSPTVPTRLAELVQALTSRSPEARPGSAREVLTKVREIRRELAGSGDQENAFLRHQRRGRILELVTRQEYDLALALLDKERLAHPESPWPPWMTARTQSLRGRFSACLRALEEAEGLGLDRRLVLEQQAFCHLQAGSNLAAYTSLSELVQESPEEPCFQGLLRWLEQA